MSGSPLGTEGHAGVLIAVLVAWSMLSCTRVSINYQRVKLYPQEARPRIAEELGISPGELAGLHRRFEVVPGAQAQVDWGDEGKILAQSASRRSTRST